MQFDIPQDIETSMSIIYTIACQIDYSDQEQLRLSSLESLQYPHYGSLYPLSR